MARKQYREAAKTAIIIANEEQISGTYDCIFILITQFFKISSPRTKTNSLNR